MYIPKHFEESRIPVLQELIEAQAFGSLITVGSCGLVASHIPMLLERKGSANGILRCHVSRANGQWRDFSPDVEALAIFSGPQHYISPSWYPEKFETGKTVPTWNYAVVHAYGHLRVIEDAAWLLAHVESLTQTHEAAFPTPWRVSDAPGEYIQSLVKGIVGLELSINRLQGKWKVSQNRPERDREGVVKGLQALNTPESLAMEALVSRALRRE
ncbi:MAG: FMN-binding negative transcriptional regulator [Acidobacteriaceae bacterium]|nr:FMN-binding negative transcriptional regulator [Acidobacteriaceae bacterium]